MAPRRILFVDQAGPVRDALVRALTTGGHDVRVADTPEAAERENDFAPDAVVYGEGFSRSVGPEAQRIALQRPVNMEELRRALRES